MSYQSHSLSIFMCFPVSPADDVPWCNSVLTGRKDGLRCVNYTREICKAIMPDPSKLFPVSCRGCEPLEGHSAGRGDFPKQRPREHT